MMPVGKDRGNGNFNAGITGTHFDISVQNRLDITKYRYNQIINNIMDVLLL